MTVADKLLLAAGHLDASGKSSFSAEDLVVAAWKRFPRDFGLRGHNGPDGLPLYPDSNRVFAEIMGSKPIRKKGYLIKVGEKIYSLTVSGRETVRALNRQKEIASESGMQEAGGKASLSRSVLAKLERLLRSRAVERVQTGEVDRLTFHDACVFWGITARSTSIELEGALADTESVIEHAQTAVEGGASELRTGSTDLSDLTINLLNRTHEILQSKFGLDLLTIRQRTDQRKA